MGRRVCLRPRTPSRYTRRRLNEALREEMRRDPSVFVMGEDVAAGETAAACSASPRAWSTSSARSASATRRSRRRASSGWRRRGGDGTAARRRAHVLRLPHPGDGPARQPGGQAPLHVRRPGRRPARRALEPRRLRRQGRAALPVARDLAHARPGPEGRRARRRPPTPRACSRPPSATTTRWSSSSTSSSTSRRARCRATSPPIPFGTAGVRRTGRDVTVVATHVMLHRALTVAESAAPRKASSSR